MARPKNPQAKRQGGLSLTPDDWEWLNEAAAVAGVPRNQVVEKAVQHYRLCRCKIQKMEGNAQKVNEGPTAQREATGVFDG